MDFYLSTGGEKITKIMMSGGTSKTPEFLNLIAQKTSLPVEPLNPFKNVAVNTKVFDVNYINEISPIVSVAVGLAIRKVGN